MFSSVTDSKNIIICRILGETDVIQFIHIFVISFVKITQCKVESALIYSV